ncbi:DNA-protecting protein DprA [Candidatus Aerophobetes bacterium]|nr:DNA-protecting protein DprA [Candidatus Aerophobetes bacterium]
MQFKCGGSDKDSLNSLSGWILLSKISSAGCPGAGKLLKYFGTPDKIFSFPLEKLIQICKIDKKTIEFIKNELPKISLEQDLDLINKLNIKLVTCKDSDYPSSLQTIAYPPILLYIRGELKKEDERAVAVVGTRRATNYGKTATRKLVRELARERITIISGMARGIDTCAHEVALEEGGRTIAVLGCGVDVVYPRENSSLMNEIIKNGAVISEFSLGTEPFARNFPRRNRIISGLSMGVVVVEAPLKSGALITADFALEQGKEVFSVPGVITSPYSEGTNRLIKEGAKVVENVYDILEELNIPFSGEKDSFTYDLQLSFEEKLIFDKLTSNPSHIDEIVRQSSLSVAKVADILMRLQLKGMVRELPGKLFLKDI